MRSSRNGKDLLFLGPAAYVNHSCAHNTNWQINGESVCTAKTIRCIKVGEEITSDYGPNFNHDNSIKHIKEENKELKSKVKFLEELVVSESRKNKAADESHSRHLKDISATMKEMRVQISNLRVTLPNAQTTNTISSTMVFVPSSENKKVAQHTATKVTDPTGTSESDSKRPISTSSQEGDSVAALRKRLMDRAKNKSTIKTTPAITNHQRTNTVSQGSMINQENKAKVVSSNSETAEALIAQGIARRTLINTNKKNLEKITKLDFNNPREHPSCPREEEDSEPTQSARDAKKPSVSSLGITVTETSSQVKLSQSDLKAVLSIGTKLGLTVGRQLYDQLATSKLFSPINEEMIRARNNLSNIDKTDHLCSTLGLYEKHVDSLKTTSTARNEILKMLRAHTESLNTFASFLAFYEVTVKAFLRSGTS